MQHCVTVRLDEELEEALERYCEQSGRSRSDVVREALWRQLTVSRFEHIRQRIRPLAEARGYLTDQDVFDQVS